MKLYWTCTLIYLSPWKRCRWVCFFIRTDLNNFSITSIAHQWILCSEWVPSEWESKQLIKHHNNTVHSIPSINVSWSKKQIHQDIFNIKLTLQVKIKFIIYYNTPVVLSHLNPPTYLIDEMTLEKAILCIEDSHLWVNLAFLKPLWTVKIFDGFLNSIICVLSYVRHQALTTGSIPGFIDVVMNLNSPALLEDNLIWQANSAGKRIIFYGDDTWVRLFPKLFMEHDGTTSFFVSDYTEVRWFKLKVVRPFNLVLEMFPGEINRNEPDLESHVRAKVFHTDLVTGSRGFEWDFSVSCASCISTPLTTDNRNAAWNLWLQVTFVACFQLKLFLEWGESFEFLTTSALHLKCHF